MHPSILGFVVGGGLTRAEIAGKDVLDVGAADWDNGNLRGLVEAFKPASYLAVDDIEGPRVDRVLPVERLVDELGANCADVVICTEVLEYVTDWQSAVTNLIGVLRPGGVLLLTTRRPGVVPQLPAANEFLGNWRFTIDALAEVARRTGLDARMVCTDPDPSRLGVFARLVKPADWQPRELDLADLDGVTAAVAPLNALILPHGMDGSTFYRIVLPYSAMQHRSGHRIMVPPPNPGAAPQLPGADELGNVDALVMQRPAGPGGMTNWGAWKGRTKLVYECDDDLLRVDPSGLPHLHDDKERDAIRFCLQLSDLITVSTPYLAEQYRQWNPNVVVLPNYIDSGLLKVERPRRERLTLGWAGGLSHLGDFMPAAAPALKSVLADDDRLDMHFIGWDFSPTLGLPRGRTRFTAWQHDVTVYYRNIDFDIGLAPLDLDSDFNRSKSHVKALELAALGIPVIASDLDPYHDFVVDGVTGFLVRTEDEWRDRLRLLADDADLRAAMGAKAREHAAGFTIQQHWPKWRDALEGVTGYGR